MNTFDYVIVGGGTAGCVLANRLSEDGRKSVLLLEAGGKRWNPWIRIPAGYFKTVFDTGLGWGYETQPEPQLNDRRIVWPRGRVLGGTGSINGMVYIRGQREDYDNWAQLGNPGWGYDEVLPYFCKSERQESGNESGSAPFHGNDGLLSVSDYPDRNPLCEAFVQAAEQVGIARNLDFNGEIQEGAGYYQITTKRGLRADTASAFLSPARRRPNLKIVTKALVSRIRFDQQRATGIDYLVDNQNYHAKAGAEIILSAGAVNSPQILQLSGIGDAAHLAGIGITPVADLPGVGANLQDHLQAQLVYRCRQPITLNDELNSNLRIAKLLMRYMLYRNGPIAGGPAPVGAFAATSPRARTPDVQIHFLPFSVARPGVLDTFSGFSFNINQCRPNSRGTIRISSASPLAPPMINPNYLSDPEDQDVLLRGLKLGRKIAGAKALEPYCDSEVKPGPEMRSCEDLLTHIRNAAGSIYHPVGTCRMGTDSMDVVDSQLKVKRVSGLRVADASVMPTLISGNTNAPTIMIAEKASDMIRKSD